jgi:hypothetical protein
VAVDGKLEVGGARLEAGGERLTVRLRKIRQIASELDLNLPNSWPTFSTDD